MNTRRRHKSQQITLNLRIQHVIQHAYGHGGETRGATAAFTAETSAAPLFARFVENTSGGGPS